MSTESSANGSAMPDARTKVSRRFAATTGPACVHLASGIRFDTDVADTGVAERRREVSGSTADVEQRAPGRRLAAGGTPQIADHRRGVGGQRAVEPCRVRLLVAEFGQQPHRAAQRRPPREDVGHGHRLHPYGRPLPDVRRPNTSPATRSSPARLSTNV